jgi:hypothetical protein
MGTTTCIFMFSDLLLRRVVSIIFNKQAENVLSRNMARHIDKSHTSSVDVTCINAVKDVWGLILLFCSLTTEYLENCIQNLSSDFD